MDRFLNHKKLTVRKILLSKKIYTKKKDIVQLKRLIFSAAPNSKENEISVLTRITRFSRTPTFKAIQNKRNKTHTLSSRILTTQSSQRYPDLHILTNVLAPFQLENDLSFINASAHHEVNWTRRKFMPPTQLYAVFYHYASSEDTFDMTVSALFTAGSSFDFSFFLRLYQLPLIEKQ